MPQETTHPIVLPTREVERIYGDFAWQPNGQSAIRIAPAWVAANIVMVHVPQLEGVATYGGKFAGRVPWHRKGVAQLQRAWADVEKAGLLDRLLFWGGSFVPRRIRGGTGLSRHSWGVAFDINVEENGLGATPAAVGKRGSVRELVPHFERHGFCWGGRWRREDGMHFELAEERSYAAAVEVPDGKLVVDNAWERAIPIYIEDGIAYSDVTAMALLVGDREATEHQRVPVGQYLAAFGYRVTWNAEQRKVYATRGGAPR